MQISLVHMSPSPQALSGRQLHPSSPARHPSLVMLDPSACPVEVPVAPLEEPLEESVESPLPSV